MLQYKHKKEIQKRIKRTCATCGKNINVVCYMNCTYRGGYYFGKIPLYHDKELDKALRAGTREEKVGGLVWNVLKKDPKPYKHEEYWECPKCYWRK